MNMPTIATKPTTTFTPVPEGTHVARVYKFMNLGQRLTEYQGVQKEYPDTLVNISFELPLELNKFTVKDKDTDEEKEVEKPFVISREFTLSMGSKSNLRPIVEGIIGTSLSDEEAYAFDLETLVGKTCQLTVVHKPSADGTKTYSNITTTAPLMKGIEVPEPFNDAEIQDVKEMTLEEIQALPDFLQKKMEDSDEFKARFAVENTEDVAPETTEEDVPFSNKN